MDTDITALVHAVGNGDAAARNELFARLYDELKRMAHRQLRRARSQTLDTTSLVHETYLKLAAPGSLNLQSRGHFFTLAAKAMRQIAIDHARARVAGKRGGGNVLAVTLDEAAGEYAQQIAPDRLLELDRALDDLAMRQPRLAGLIELRVFTGLEMAEIAALQAVSERTVNRDWRLARAELYSAMYP